MRCAFTIGNSAALATYEMNDGALTVTGDTYVGQSFGLGQFLQTGGTASFQAVTIAQSSGSSGEFIMSGGSSSTTLDLNLTVTGGGNTVSFQPIAGYDHTVQYSDTLKDLSWVDVPGALHNSGEVNLMPPGVPQRYYRVKIVAP